MIPLPPLAAEAVALLAWYREMGVDAALGDDPVDWLSRGDVKPGAAFQWPGGEQTPPQRQVQPERIAPAQLAPRPAPSPQQGSGPHPSERPSLAITAPAPRQFPTATPDKAAMAARSAARSARDLTHLRDILTTFNGCALKATAKHLCFSRGPDKARLMLIGEAPGRDEDIEGRPFVGRAGQLLDKMLAAIGRSDADTHITNIVYWRPPGNRTPTPQEAEVCRPFLERQIELVEPEMIVLLGGAAAKHILAVPEGIMRLRGKWHEMTIAGRSIHAMATLHPAYLLRTPLAKRQAWRDWLAVASALRHS
jgi:DNA polymerase